MTDKKTANDTQVGGTHYGPGTKLQHWDLATMFKWDPFQYQITKYVMRWKDKHATPEKRLEDLKKARHFLDKYIEEYAAWDDHATTLQVNGPPVREFHVHDPAQPCVNTEWQCEGWYGDGTSLYRHKASRAIYRARTLEEAEVDHLAAMVAGAGLGYVNQDR